MITLLLYSTYCVAIIAILWVTYEPKIKTEEKKLTNLGWLSILLLFFSVASIGFSFYAPFLFTGKKISIQLPFTPETGSIGDTVGGLMNPFIALAGVIVTGLAFFMQYRANKLQIRLFEKGQKDSNEQFQYQLNQQQFESQFYEMLRLHKENVNEMELPGKEYIGNSWDGFLITKRQVFQQMQLELESLIERAAIDLLPADAQKPYIGIELSQKQFEECYKIFFWGYDSSKHYNLTKDTLSWVNNVFVDRYPTGIDYFEMPGSDLNFSIKAYKGHSSMLGHYFRHLYMMVKFVAESKIVTSYNDRMRYLKILRAQLSNYEQIMLFYNWISSYGGPWEDNEHAYFTEYCMIHNLWYDELINNDFIRKKIQQLIKKPFKLREGPLFEVGDDI
ncbi:putative phage abortive infection protein [Pedobacter sp. UBA5917]|jgi:hypothetical protein|uniref:putative phage abortive infection protein n=1 Tax=Pedobacter sp. UBA5917 TaxID=1947061 RepID=UPI0025CC9DBF|nr:putative phage abortive infection protein [Pedobacter sp. UBA5917]